MIEKFRRSNYMNGKVVDTSKVEIYINKVIDADKVFSKIKSISMKKDSSGNIIPCTNVDYEAHFDYHGGINFVNGGYKIVCDSDFIKVMKSLTYPRIISRNEINNLRKTMINDLNDTFKDSGKDMIISCDNGEFPQKIKSVYVTIVRYESLSRKCYGRSKSVELKIVTYKDSTIVINISPDSFDVCEFDDKNCITDCNIYLYADIVNLIQNTINILSKPDMIDNMFNLFKDELPLICNHHSIKVVRCDEEGKIYD